MENLYLQNYMYQLDTLNQLIRLNKPIFDFKENDFIIKTYNKFNIKSDYLYQLLWNTIINSPEFNILLLQKKPIDIEVNIPVKNTAGIFILEDYTFDINTSFDINFDAFCEILEIECTDLDHEDFCYIDISIGILCT